MQADDADDDRSDEEDPREGRRFVEEDDPEGGSPDGPDPGPDRVGSPHGKFLDSLGQQNHADYECDGGPERR